MSFAPSPQQQAFFDRVDDEDGGNILLEAVAGAGKTTTIVKAAKERMKGYVFIGAYNSKMAKELKERVSTERRIFASTFHSAGLRALRYAYEHTHALTITDKKVPELVGEITTVRDDLKVLAPAIPGIVSMAKQRGFGIDKPLNLIGDREWHEMISFFGLDEALPDGARMDQVIAFSKAVLNRSNANLGQIDYDDMVYLPLANKLRMLTNDWVLIDEAQDTNPTRRALAAKMLKPGGRLVAVGDPHQAIFGFTGADNDSLAIIEREFDCVKMPLSVTYRCPKSVVEHAQQWVSHITAHESAPDGEVAAMGYDDLLDTTQPHHVQPGDAILCRNNRYLATTFFKLVRAGFSAKIEGKAIGQGLAALAGKWKVKTLDALTGRLEAYATREIKKALEAKNEARADHVEDQVETLYVLISRARETGIETVQGLVDMIMTIFADDVADDKSMVVLCSAHRSKGLEWDRVFLLGREELMPSRFARQKWQVEQEINLIYVAVTRAKKLLVEVNGIVEEKRKEY